MKANTKNPETASLGPYKIIKQMREQMTKVVTGGKRVNRYRALARENMSLVFANNKACPSAQSDQRLGYSLTGKYHI